MTSGRGKNIDSGKTPRPDQTIDKLRAARDKLYSDMEKDPTTSIPWSVHQLLDNINGMVDGQGPAQSNGMAKVLSAPEREQNGLKHRIGLFLVQHTGTLDYDAVYNAFPDDAHGYIKQCLNAYKHGKLELQSTDGIKYKVSGGRAVITISTDGKGPGMPENVIIPNDKIKSRKKGDLTLLFLYDNPGASDKDIALYVGFTKRHASRTVTSLGADGYVEEGSRKLTEQGVAYVEALKKGVAKEPLLPRVRAYLTANEGSDVGIDDVMLALPGERRTALNNYLGFFARGDYKIDGYEISRADSGKLHVRKLVAESTALATVSIKPRATVPSGDIQPSHIEEISVLYAADAGSINDIYTERPRIREMIGDRVGFEPTLLEARNSVRPERVGRFYETVEKIPLDHGRMGTPHNYFFRLVLRDPDSAGKMMAWAQQQNGITTEAFMSEMDKYKSAVAR
ncbi:MAG: hypothetical protein V1836_04045 [Candidatus Aenigmatarchaeota archaeon]